MKNTRYLFVVVILLSLLGCSSTQRAYLQNIKMFMQSNTDIEVSADELEALDVDLIYVNNGDRARATMALAFVDDQAQKWVSRDGVMLSIKHGRIVRTLGLQNNLRYLHSKVADPLENTLAAITTASWQALIDADHEHFGTQLMANYSVQQDSSIEVLGRVYQTTKVQEHIQFQQGSKQGQYTNQYWYDTDKSVLLKSSQRYTPNSDVITITYISRALRLQELADE